MPRPANRSFATAPAGNAGAAADDGLDGDARAEALLRQVALELDGVRTRTRSLKPYCWFRHLRQRADTLPGRFSLGNDFEILARRR